MPEEMPTPKKSLKELEREKKQLIDKKKLVMETIEEWSDNSEGFRYLRAVRKRWNNEIFRK